MSKARALLLTAVAGALLVAVVPRHLEASAQAAATATTTGTVALPTVSVENTTPVYVPTVTVPQLVHKTTKHRSKKPAKTANATKTKAKPVQSAWIWAFLTSYCPGSAGWLSSSGATVFYGMLANNYYSFGTHVFLPVLNLTGVVDDRMSYYAAWNQFDVWSPTCFGTPTGWFRVAVKH